ncbi:MAG: hypothetical protein PWQ58_1237 [Archaeoglobaceae archaeon]|nr:hypothetical protein [Archaeoglobaceae archaeon]
MDYWRLFVGLALVVIGLTIGLAVLNIPNSNVSYGAIVLIGPIPIVVASDVAIAIFVLLIAVIFLLMTAFLHRVEDLKFGEDSYPEFQEETRIENKTEKKFGGVVLIGPIPIVFGDTKLAVFALILTITLMFLSLLLIFGWLI